MENSGVCCNVSQCCHYKQDDKCQLAKIHITNEKTSADAIATPHFCKNYEQK